MSEEKQEGPGGGLERYEIDEETARELLDAPVTVDVFRWSDALQRHVDLPADLLWLAARLQDLEVT